MEKYGDVKEAIVALVTGEGITGWGDSCLDWLTNPLTWVLQAVHNNGVPGVGKKRKHVARAADELEEEPAASEEENAPEGSEPGP